MTHAVHLARILAAAALASLFIVLSGLSGAHSVASETLGQPVVEAQSEGTTPEPSEAVALSPAGTVLLNHLEQHLLDLLNGERVAQGLDVLEVDQQLVDLARQRSNDMITRGYFGHVTPEGIMVFELMDEYGIPYRLAGENLARNRYPHERSPEVAHRGFMNSPKHRDNDLHPRFNRVGIGVAESPNGFIYFTELFTEVDRQGPSPSSEVNSGQDAC